MLSITIGSTVIPYEIRRSSKSKKVSINVTHDKVEIVAPVNIDDIKIISFIESKKNWVYQKRERLLEVDHKQNIDTVTHYRTGTKILYRGRRTKLTVTPDGLYNLKVQYRNGLHVSIPPSDTGKFQDWHIKKALDKWFKLKVCEDCRGLSKKYGKLLNLEPKGIRIKEQKHLWGSCGHDDILNFNWRLLRAPKKVLEYVVAHEVCHLKYRNHDNEFWSLLDSVFNEVDECKKWLEQEGITI